MSYHVTVTYPVGTDRTFSSSMALMELIAVLYAAIDDGTISTFTVRDGNATDRIVAQH